MSSGHFYAGSREPIAADCLARLFLGPLLPSGEMASLSYKGRA